MSKKSTKYVKQRLGMGQMPIHKIREERFDKKIIFIDSKN